MNRMGRMLHGIDNILERLIFDRLLAGRGKVIVALFLALTLGVGGWLIYSDAPSSSTSATSLKWLQNRPWWDKYPNDPRGKYHVYLFTNNRNIGAYIEVTAYRANYEFFLYKVVGSKLVYLFPENKQKGMTKIEINDIRGSSFDLALAFEGDPRSGDRAKKYFSWKKIKGETLETVMLDRIKKTIAKLPDDFSLIK